MKKIKIGVLGAGGIGTVHLDSYMNNPDCEVVAICDSNNERVQEKAKKYNIPNTFTNYDKMLEMDLDGISICTWNNTHAAASIAALKAGKNVLCEKPPAMNTQQAKEMVDEARRNRKLLMIGFVRRFGETASVVKDFIKNGKFGEIYYAKTGCIRRCGNPGGWFSHKELSGGGPLIDLGVHIIDLAMYLMGKPRVVSVTGNTYNKIGSRSHIKGYNFYKSADYNGYSDVEDSANALVKFENGASLFVETSFVQNIKKDVLYMDIYGNKGGASIEPEFEIYTEENGYMVDIKPVLSSSSFDFRQGFNSEINHFIDSIRGKVQCISPGEDGITIMQILDAIYESSLTGEMIKIK
jgi:predicted dehydrogenase